MLFRSLLNYFFFFKQKTAYEIYQCDWSSDVCSSDLAVCAMPNTDPVADNAAVLQSLIEQAEAEAVVRVAFMGAISHGLDGERLSDMWDLADAGAVAFTDDGSPVDSGGLLRAARSEERRVGKECRSRLSPYH